MPIPVILTTLAAQIGLPLIIEAASRVLPRVAGKALSNIAGKVAGTAAGKAAGKIAGSAVGKAAGNAVAGAAAAGAMGTLDEAISSAMKSLNEAGAANRNVGRKARAASSTHAVESKRRADAAAGIPPGKVLVDQFGRPVSSGQPLPPFNDGTIDILKSLPAASLILDKNGKPLVQGTMKDPPPIAAPVLSETLKPILDQYGNPYGSKPSSGTGPILDQFGRPIETGTSEWLGRAIGNATIPTLGEENSRKFFSEALRKFKEKLSRGKTPASGGSGGGGGGNGGGPFAGSAGEESDDFARRAAESEFLRREKQRDIDFERSINEAKQKDIDRKLRQYYQKSALQWASELVPKGMAHVATGAGEAFNAYNSILANSLMNAAASAYTPRQTEMFGNMLAAPTAMYAGGRLARGSVGNIAGKHLGSFLSNWSDRIAGEFERQRSLRINMDLNPVGMFMENYYKLGRNLPGAETVL